MPDSSKSPVNWIKHIGFALVLTAIVLFIPGITMTMFTLSMEMTVNVSGNEFSPQLIDQQLSILSTVEELWQQNRFLVSALIFGFSVLIPILKTLLVSLVYLVKDSTWQYRLSSFVSMIGKWSMADVFVVAVFLAVLSTNHAESTEQQQVVIFGFNIPFGISSETLSNIGPGFYYFTAYCLISILGSQLVLTGVKKQNQA